MELKRLETWIKKHPQKAAILMHRIAESDGWDRRCYEQIESITKEQTDANHQHQGASRQAS